MRLESTFRIPVPAEVVFDNFLDPDTMRRSVPGCTVMNRIDPNTYRGELTNQVAHVKFNAAVAADITSMRRPHQIRAVLSGEDRRLGSTLRLDAELDVVSDGAVSVVSYAMEVAMWGKLGRMGEAIFRRQTADVQQQFVETFTKACLGELPPAPGPAPTGTAPRPGPGQRTATISRPHANGKVTARAAPMIGTPGELLHPVGRVATAGQLLVAEGSDDASFPVPRSAAGSDRGLGEQALGRQALGRQSLVEQSLVALCGGLGAGLGLGLGAGLGFAAARWLIGRPAPVRRPRLGGGG